MSLMRYSAGFVLMVVLFMPLRSEASAESVSLDAKVRERAASIENKLIAWRRDIHQHPELGDQENRTSRLVAEHLRSLGMEVRTGIARTGVVGVLKGSKPGRTVALRADMDALPVKEPDGLPFASKAKGLHWGEGHRCRARLRPRCTYRHADGGGRSARRLEG